LPDVYGGIQLGIWGQAISASVPYGLTRREEFGQVIQKTCVAKTLEGFAAFLDIQEGRSEPQATSKLDKAQAIG